MGGTDEISVTRIDALVSELRTLREVKGVSYRELATTITDRRIADGKNPAAARIAHTTISDAFRLGRRRLNAGLIAEIVAALDEDEDSVATWRARVAGAAAGDPAPVDPLPAAEPMSHPAVAPRVGRSPGWILVVLIAGLLLNSTGKFLNPLLGDVFFFDMVGTALAAILAGPWVGAGVGVLFIGVELLKGQLVAAMFSITMVTAGLIWGFGARRYGLAESLPRFLALSALVAVATSLIAVPITVFYLGGVTDRGLDELRDAVIAVTAFDDESAIGLVNFLVSLIDKLAVGAAAYSIATLVRRVDTDGLRVPAAS